MFTSPTTVAPPGPFLRFLSPTSKSYSQEQDPMSLLGSHLKNHLVTEALPGYLI